MSLLNYLDISAALATLELREVPVIAHASLHAFGRVDGGGTSFVQALIEAVGALIMPTHTYSTMITPTVGPNHNGIVYGSAQDMNRMAEFYSPSMPADRLMGVVPEALRQRSDVKRSMHPILSFAGVGFNKALDAQTMAEPLAPIRMLAESGGWVLLLGVDHTTNTAIHYAEKLAGRRQFVRWALTEDGIIECPGFHGDSSGFQVIEKDLQPHTKKLQIGNALVQAIPLKALISVVVERLKQNPKDLLCSNPSCLRCNELRKT
jgi:aminoglycoside 3-N-acetyltransferase